MHGRASPVRPVSRRLTPPAAAHSVRGVEQADSGQIAFYLERARECGETVIELGCGSGVISVALALAGLEVLAFDPSEALVAQASERRRALGILPERCRFERADLRSLRLGRKVGFVFAANDSLTVLPGPEDLAAVFTTARAHVLDEGSFAFDIRQSGVLRTEAGPIRSRLEQRAQAIRRPYLRVRTGGTSELHRLRLLGLSSDEIEDTLAASGFMALERWGGFGGEPYEPTSERMVVVARPS